MSRNILKEMEEEFGEVTDENLAKARKAGPENNLTLPPPPKPNTNSILFDSLSKSYDKLNKIYKEFNNIYIRVPSGKAEQKERYATLLRLKTEFDNEYTTINESLRYSGNDRGVRNLIKDITKLRGELLLITRSIRHHDIGLTYTMGNAYKQFIKKYDTLKQLINTDPNQNIETIKTYYETTIEPIKRTFESEFNRLDQKNVSPAIYRNVEEKKAIVNRMSAELRSRINGIERESTDPRIKKWREQAKKYATLIKGMKNNKNALNNGTLASLFPNMNRFEEQRVPLSASPTPPNPVRAPQPLPPGDHPIASATPPNPVRASPPQPPPNKPLRHPVVSAVRGRRLALVNPPQLPQSVSPREIPKEKKRDEYIQTMPDKRVFKIVDVDELNKTANVAALNRTTKTWGPVEQLTKEQIDSSRIIKCSSSPQAGGRHCRRTMRAKAKTRPTRRLRKRV